MWITLWKKAYFYTIAHIFKIETIYIFREFYSVRFYLRNLKKNARITVAALLAAMLVAACCAPLISETIKKNHSVIIVVDAGHGGVDGGVTGAVTGVKESELNLKIAKYLVEILKAAGFYVVETRHAGYGLYGESLDNFKRRDMEKRAEIINKAQPDAVISIHLNFYSAKTRRGAQVFFRKASESSKNFADIVQEKLNDGINADTANRKFSALTAEKYILECTSAPVIIAECGFLSNPLDEALLIKPEYQVKLARVLADGITEFLDGGEKVQYSLNH